MRMDDVSGFYEEVGRRIRAARKRVSPRMTQQGLANLAALTRTSITNVEKGRQKVLLHTLADIATALQVEPGSLLPTLEAAPERKLEDALKNRPRSEKDWVQSTVNAARKGGRRSGS
jgi:transcriptional regulator with XRE-family HTH domain